MAEIDPLPDDIQSLLKRAQGGAPPPPAGVEAAVLAKVGSTVASAAGAVGVGGAAATTIGASAGTSLASLGLLAVGAFVAIGVVVGVVVTRGADAPAVAPAIAPAAAPPTVDAAPQPAVDLVLDDAVVAAPSPPTAAAPPAAPPIAASPTAAPAIDGPAVAAPAPRARAAQPSRAAEGALIESARDALARGDADTAIAKLEEHQKTFGARGQLVEERHALTVVAFAQRGDRARAQSAAKAFFRLYPTSLFSDTVRAAAGAE